MILILDDEPWYVEPYVDALSLEGHQTTVLASADEFIKLIQSGAEPSAVVIDVVLGGGAYLGLWALERLRRVLPSTPVVLLTNLDVERFRHHRDAHTIALCKRDTTPRDLCSTLDSLLTVVNGAAKDSSSTEDPS